MKLGLRYLFTCHPANFTTLFPLQSKYKNIGTRKKLVEFVKSKTIQKENLLYKIDIILTFAKHFIRVTVLNFEFDSELQFLFSLP